MTTELTRRNMYLWVQATISFIRNETISYAACRTQGCSKKMTHSPSDGRWFCEKCGNYYDTPDYRYILSLSLSDSTGTIFATAFNKVRFRDMCLFFVWRLNMYTCAAGLPVVVLNSLQEGTAILGGRKADEMEMLKTNEPEQFKAIVSSSTFQSGVFKLRLKEESFGEQVRNFSCLISVFQNLT